MNDEKPFDSIPVNQWQSVVEHYVSSKTIDKQLELLTKLNGFLEGMVEEDIQKTIDLRVQIERLTKGGGC